MLSRVLYGYPRIFPEYMYTQPSSEYSLYDSHFSTVLLTLLLSMLYEVPDRVCDVLNPLLTVFF